MVRKRGVNCRGLCPLPTPIPSAWQGTLLGVKTKVRSNPREGFCARVPPLTSVPPAEMHRHPHWEGVLGTCRWWEGHLQLLGLTFFLAITWLWHSASRYVMERMKATELHSSHPAAIWTSLFNDWDQDSISQSQIYIRTAQDWYISSM